MEDQNYHISTDPTMLDVNMVYEYLAQESYWAKGIPFDKLKKAIANSLCFGVYKGNSQVGFARVISDMATYAYLCDLFILPEHRGLGLSKMLLSIILTHPDLLNLRRWSLATADAHLLYRQFGFLSLIQPKNWMEIFSPYA